MSGGPVWCGACGACSCPTSSLDSTRSSCTAAWCNWSWCADGACQWASSGQTCCTPSALCTRTTLLREPRLPDQCSPPSSSSGFSSACSTADPATYGSLHAFTRSATQRSSGAWARSDSHDKRDIEITGPSSRSPRRIESAIFLMAIAPIICRRHRRLHARKGSGLKPAWGGKARREESSRVVGQLFAADGARLGSEAQIDPDGEAPVVAWSDQGFFVTAYGWDGSSIAACRSDGESRAVPPGGGRPSTPGCGAARPRTLNPIAGNWLPRCGRSIVSHRLHPRQSSFWTVVQVSFVLLALCGVPAVFAEEPVRITLADALSLAEQQNPDLASARAQAAAAGEEAAAVRRGTWPRLDLSTGWSYTDIPSAVFAHKLDAGEFTTDDFAISRLNDPSALWHLGTTLAVEAPIDAFGKVRTAAESAAARARSADAQVSEALLDLRLQVVTAYRHTAFAKRAVEATEHALEGARAREADVEARVTAGAALQSDLLRARARRREREADLAER